MRRSVSAAIAVFTIAGIGGASGADLINYPTSTAKTVQVASTGPTFDWNGFYAGVYGAYQHSPVGGEEVGLGIDAGVNTTFNFVLAGAEVAVQGLGAGAGTTTAVQGLVRAGVLVSDNTAIYGAAGYGLQTSGPSESDLLAGGGVEFAVTDNVTLRAQYLHGFPVTGANPKDQVSLGAQFHF